MAETALSAPQGANAPFTSMAPPAALMRVLGRFDRQQLEGFIAVAIELADLQDGDPDCEGLCDEDEISRCTDFGLAVRSDGPGCVIGDPDRGVDDDGEETMAEDAFWHGPIINAGPGCPVADPGGCEHDGREQQDGY
ncbi:hypothetical protein GCM10011371_08550 [Novosphingobium marinum]|uniref:Uncharacterized protein n=1 Tax=Novosphingobium marinum TaxID=1514948 RepID=A0A7Y9XWT5_9SPHN|nr:hypothetical protein [Novosphingobium marinum]NYH94543.1 hypothetical protein [Novosphingobium marinum]GGC23127.1 hypothetical protein GCM10011371_08550 [Novosphingobium marinum]